jgi:hypothetical protein
MMPRFPDFYPADFNDKTFVALTNRERGCAGTMKWHLVVSGALDPEHVRTALTDVVRRYSILSMKLEALDGVPPRVARLRFARDPGFSIDGIFRAADLREAPHRLTALVHEELNSPLDPFAETPLTLTMALTSSTATHLIFRVHHVVADGHAIVDLLREFRAFLELARRGARPPADALEPVPRRSQLDALQLGWFRRAIETALGCAGLTASLARRAFFPPTQLLSNLSNDYTGDNCALHWVLPDECLEQWKPACERLDASLNSLLTGALFAAVQRWHAAHGLSLGRTVGMIFQDTRPRDPAFVSFSNYVTSIEVSLGLHRLHDPIAIVRGAHAAIQARIRAQSGVRQQLALLQLAAHLDIATMSKMVFETSRASLNLSFSNLLPFPVNIGGAGWSVRDLYFTGSPAPRFGFMLTAIRAGGRVVFNFNYKSSAVTRTQVDELARAFEDVIQEIAGRRVEGRWEHRGQDRHSPS